MRIEASSNLLFIGDSITDCGRARPVGEANPWNWGEIGNGYVRDVAATIGTPGSSVNASGPTVMQPIAFSRNDFGGDSQNNLSPTMRVAGNAGGMLAVAVTAAVPVAFEPGSIARNAGPSGESVLSPTLRSQMGDNQPAVRIDMQVRRLTPVECERLQGFPDGYTAIPWRKKPASECPDGPRYKALGNSMAVPVMRWIGERIDNHLK